MLPFMKEGISVGDRSGYREHRAERPARSAALGKCLSQERALRSGRHDRADRGRGKSREPTRHRRHTFVGEHGMGAHRLSLLPNYDMITVCVYDLAQFSASVVMDILRTHPQVIVGGVLRENPFYAPPDEFLRELSSRGARPH